MDESCRLGSASNPAGAAPPGFPAAPRAPSDPLCALRPVHPAAGRPSACEAVALEELRRSQAKRAATLQQKCSWHKGTTRTKTSAGQTDPLALTSTTAAPSRRFLLRVARRTSRWAQSRSKRQPFVTKKPAKCLQHPAGCLTEAIMSGAAAANVILINQFFAFLFLFQPPSAFSFSVVERRWSRSFFLKSRPQS